VLVKSSQSYKENKLLHTTCRGAFWLAKELKRIEGTPGQANFKKVCTYGEAFADRLPRVFGLSSLFSSDW
jgi:hypothetical protein